MNNFPTYALLVIIAVAALVLCWNLVNICYNIPFHRQGIPTPKTAMIVISLVAIISMIGFITTIANHIQAAS
jgi:hypothetical protein